MKISLFYIKLCTEPCNHFVHFVIMLNFVSDDLGKKDGIGHTLDSDSNEKPVSELEIMWERNLSL